MGRGVLNFLPNIQEEIGKVGQHPYQRILADNHRQKMADVHSGHLFPMHHQKHEEALRRGTREDETSDEVAGSKGKTAGLPTTARDDAGPFEEIVERGQERLRIRPSSGNHGNHICMDVRAANQRHPTLEKTLGDGGDTEGRTILGGAANERENGGKDRSILHPCGGNPQNRPMDNSRITTRTARPAIPDNRQNDQRSPSHSGDHRPQSHPTGWASRHGQERGAFENDSGSVLTSHVAKISPTILETRGSGDRASGTPSERCRQIEAKDGHTSRSSKTEERLTHQMITSNWPIKAHPHATIDEVNNYDIHVKEIDVEKLPDLDGRLAQILEMENEIRNFINGRGGNHTDHDLISKRFIRALRTLDRVHRLTLDLPHDLREKRCMELADKDIEEYHRRGLIEKVDCNEPSSANLRMFSTTEDKVLNGKPKRRRGITHTPLHNKYATLFEKIRLKSPRDQAREVKTAAICLDFAAFFNQIRLGHRTYWIFEDNHGQKWRLLTIPTGATFSPLFAQLITEAIGRWLEAACPYAKVHTYIDNLRISANTEDAVRHATKILLEKLKMINIKVNETAEDIVEMNTKIFQHLGIGYDLTNEASIKITITPKQTKKIHTLAKQDLGKLTMREIMSYFGVLMFASQILEIPRAPYYQAIKFMRRRAAEKALLDAPAEIWPSSIQIFTAWANEILKRAYATPHEIMRVGTIIENWDTFTDASGTGYGVVVLTPTETIIRAQRWSAAEGPLHINLLEAKALLHGVQMTSTEARRRHVMPYVKFHVDNTSVIGSVAKTHSSSFSLNKEVQKICDHISQNVTRWSTATEIRYIRSAANLADGPSRQTQCTMMHITTGIYRKSLWEKASKQGTEPPPS